MSKYQRVILGLPALQGDTDHALVVDVYDVLVAFGVTCPATQHAVKKLLCPGQRGHKGKVEDLKEAMVSIQLAVTIAEQTKG